MRSRSMMCWWAWTARWCWPRWARPLEGARTGSRTADRHYEEWIYGQLPQTVHFVRFEGDRVTQVRIAALGKPIAIHNQERDARVPRPRGHPRDRHGRRSPAMGRRRPQAPHHLEAGRGRSGESEASACCRCRQPRSGATQDKIACRLSGFHESIVHARR